MKDPFTQHGAFSWCELTTTDPKAAGEFYARLLGWEAEEMPMQDGTYTVVKAGGEPIGGIMSTPPQAPPCPPHWGVYVTVADVDATARSARGLGAAVLLEPVDIPGVGRFCVIQDPQGAVLSLITYASK